ncbi:MAG: ABC transporter ATP-binding protein [Proteobacteria bacterium]|nr:ABC transporter ATP-binding protein [Pseudomonadota bacterium]
MDPNGSERRAAIASAPLVELSGVSRVFDNGAIVALRDIDLSIGAGECVAIVGPSGSGKSSLVNMLSGFDIASQGTVSWNGVPVLTQREWAKLRGSEIGIVFQEFNLLPTLTAIENVEIPMFDHGISAPERRRRAAESLERVGLGGRRNHLPFKLSGGERQRVAIARSLVNRPKLLLADEPTGNLDRANSELVSDLLFGACAGEGAALVLVTHDETLAQRCPRCVRLLDGRIASDTVHAPNG